MTRAAGAEAMARHGVVEWFRLGDHDRVDPALDRMQALGFGHLRTHLSWADYHAEGGRDWYDWLIPRLAARVRLLPCVHYVPPSLSETGRSNGPPRELDAYAAFVDEILTRYEGCFGEIELWNEPNNLLDWDWRVDTDWLKFCTMVGAAAHWAQTRGIFTVLGGPCPLDLNWLRIIGERGVLDKVDAIALHGFPGTWDSNALGWRSWEEAIASVRSLAAGFGLAPQVWITEGGYSTWRHDVLAQVASFVELIDAPADRRYWYALEDIAPGVEIQEGVNFDVRHYHFGLYDATGAPKLLARQLAQGGLPTARTTAALHHPRPAIVGRRPALVTGGAGFIGCNLANRLAESGEDVLVYDALARPGVERNLEWLTKRHPARVSVAVADLRETAALADAVGEASSVFHLASQVAVTTSLGRPLEDFEINAAATVSLLEAVRRQSQPVPVVFASTNKVYGDLAAVELALTDGGYRPVDLALAAHGVDESRPLDFHTPYGCSKGAADSYVLDYARSYGVPAAVLRMSCIYGPHQLGTEDQGWVAHFLISALEGRPVTIYGDGNQIRDILFVDDAVSAYVAARRHIGTVGGRAFNLGGGPENAVSVRQVLAQIERITGRPVDVGWGDWRAGDQRYYVSDTRALRAALDLPKPLGWRRGIERLAAWLADGRPEPGFETGRRETA